MIPAVKRGENRSNLRKSEPGGKGAIICPTLAGGFRCDSTAPTAGGRPG